MNNKEKIRNVILDIISETNYPTLDPQQVVDNLPKFWQALKDASLIPDGMQYNDLVNICVNSANNAMVEKHMMDFHKSPPAFVKSTVVSSKIKE